MMIVNTQMHHDTTEEGKRENGGSDHKSIKVYILAIGVGFRMNKLFSLYASHYIIF